MISVAFYSGRMFLDWLQLLIITVLLTTLLGLLVLVLLRLTELLFELFGITKTFDVVVVISC